jgi:hypothetical protein
MSAGVTTRLGCAAATTDRVIAEDAIRVLDHGFVRLEDSMANDLSVARSTVVGWLSGCGPAITLQADWERPPDVDTYRSGHFFQGGKHLLVAPRWSALPSVCP